MGKVLVTGASGYTGKCLCRSLLEDGEDLVAFVRPTSQIQELKALGIECRQVDIKDLVSVQDNFSGIDRVYHLAAAYRTELSDRNEFRSVNVGGTENLLKAAKAEGVQRFVHCSTVGVQGKIKHPPADEDYRFNPGDHYQQSKLEGELLVRKYISDGLAGAVVRPVGIYGPGDNRFLKLFVSINKGCFVMIGSGKVLYHMTYIDDLVQGLLLAGRKPEALGEVFTIAGEKYTTIRELVDLIADVLGKTRPAWRIPFYPVFIAALLCDKICRPRGIPPPLYPRRMDFFCKDRAFTIEKAKRLLGYMPRVTLYEGLSKTAAWYKKQRLL